MGVHRSYTEDDQAKVAITLLVNEGNIKRTARELLMPISTVRQWKTKWEVEGYPNTEQTLLPSDEDSYTKLERLHDRAIDLLAARVRAQDIQSRDLIQAIKIISDKLSMIKGLPSSRSETVHTFPDMKVLQDSLHSYIGEIVDSAHQRQEEIVDAEIVEDDQLSLTKGE